MTHTHHKPRTRKHLQDAAKPTLKQYGLNEPNWFGECSNCGASPTHPQTGMCGPCTFGEAEMVGGNW
jgi:hypothetical protein